MIRNFLRNFMIGRYGPDQLNMALIVIALIFGILSSILNLFILSIISYVFLILAIIRMLSRRVEARRKENDRFLRIWWPIRTKIVNYFKRLKDSKHYRFFKCPGCGNTLRVPKGKGKIQITCPRCGERFIKKS
ncbi:MAG: hypothetical protein HUJ65_06685 [Oscillospiraceae bacterium]|nr:hypothetical protein [Oscillospiraceae bacterium]